MSWSPRLFERSARWVLMCPCRSTARFMRRLGPSGFPRVGPFPARIWAMDFPVARWTFGTAYVSRRRAPIEAFEAPSPWSFTMISMISSASRGTHSGFFWMNGRVEPCWPFLFAWILAMEATPYFASVYEGYAVASHRGGSLREGPGDSGGASPFAGLAPIRSVAGAHPPGGR